MGKGPGACSRSVPALGIGVQYPRLGEGAPATSLSSSTAERGASAAAAGGGRMAGGASRDGPVTVSDPSFRL